MTAANRANRPSVGSPTAKPPMVANTIKLAATVALIMFSNLLPFCVWYVYYGAGLQVLVIYKDFVIILLFEDGSG
jgi:hypothetical protein